MKAATPMNLFNVSELHDIINPIRRVLGSLRMQIRFIHRSEDAYPVMCLNDSYQMCRRFAHYIRSFRIKRISYSPKVLVIPRNRWLRLNMTEKIVYRDVKPQSKQKQTNKRISLYSQLFERSIRLNAVVSLKFVF